MSNACGMPPKQTAIPGRISCVSTSPARISAVSWASVPASVTGALMPAWAIGPIGTGRGTAAVSNSTSIPAGLNRSGLIGSRNGYPKGCAAASSAEPATAAKSSTTNFALGPSWNQNVIGLVVASSSVAATSTHRRAGGTSCGSAIAPAMFITGSTSHSAPAAATSASVANRRVPSGSSQCASPAMAL